MGDPQQTGPHPLLDTKLVDVGPDGGVRISLDGLAAFHRYYTPAEAFNPQLAIWVLGCHLLEQSGLLPELPQPRSRKRR